MPNSKLFFCLRIFFVFAGQLFIAGIAKAQLQKAADSHIRQGNMYTGLTFNVDNSKIENEDRLIVFIEDRKKNAFKINVDAGYFIKNNWAVGGLINYGSSRREGFEINTQSIRAEVKQKETNWGVYGTTKFYLPLDDKERFSLYNYVLLGGVFRDQLTESTADAVLTRTFLKERTAELRFIPGIMVNAIKGFSIEAGAEIAGVKTKWSNTTINNEPYTKKESFSADLSINLLRLSLGFYYFFDVNRKK